MRKRLKERLRERAEASLKRLLMFCKGSEMLMEGGEAGATTFGYTAVLRCVTILYECLVLDSCRAMLIRC